MASLSLTVRTDITEAAIRKLKAKALPAISRALNRSIASGRTAMVKAMAPDLGLPAAYVRERLVVQEATARTLTARLYASSKKIPLITFNARGPVPSRGKGRGVTARMPGGQGRYPNAFIATVRSPRNGTHLGVFERNTGANRRGAKPNRSQLPIHELFGPSLGYVFEKYRPMGLARAEEQLVKNITHELRFALEQAAG